MSTVPAREVHVLAGVIFDGQNRVLLAQRPAGKDLAGFWEFPGGKIEPGETRYGALARELREELGIEIGPARPLTRVRHAYPYKTVLLDFWIVRQFSGEFRGLDGQALRWCELAELKAVPLLPADRPMLRLIGLPEVIVARSGPGFEIFDSPQAASSTLVAGVLCSDTLSALTAVAEGADFIVMSGELTREQALQLCLKVPVPAFLRGMDLGAAWQLGASGINRLLG